MRASLKRIENIAQDIKTFWLEPKKPIDYVAGQFIEITLPHDNADQRGQKRWFTLSSSPTEELIGITTKQTPDLGSSFKKTLFDLKLGANITISSPMGDFVLPKDSSIPLFFVAGGMGVTPMRSMIKWLADTNDKRDIRMIYGARSLKQIVFYELLQSHTNQLDLVLSEPTAEWEGLSGYITSRVIFDLIPSNHNQSIFFISGPEQWVEQLETDLLTAGVAKHHLVLDFFPGYPPH